MAMNCNIESIGVKYPDNYLTTVEIESQLKTKKPIKLELLTGINERKICSENEDSISLAVDACFDCLKYSKYEADEIEMIICCSISKYVNGLKHCYEPALSLLIKQKIGNKKALNFDISNACAGMITGIKIANNFITQGVVQNCLVVSGECISNLSQNALKNVNSLKHPELASLTVGDAGAAVLLASTQKDNEGIAAFELVTLSKYSNLCTGYQNTEYPGAIMKTDMKRIHEVSIKNAPYFMEKALKKAGLTIGQIDFFIPHQTAKMAIDSGTKLMSEYFKEKLEEVIINLEKTGNTASTTHFTTLYKCLQENRFKPGNNIMLLSFASGLIIGVLIFTINDLIAKYGNNN